MVLRWRKAKPTARGTQKLLYLGLLTLLILQEHHKGRSDVLGSLTIRDLPKRLRFS